MGSLDPGIHKVCLSPLSISRRYGVWCLNAISPLLPSCWGLSFAPGSELSPHNCSSAPIFYTLPFPYYWVSFPHLVNSGRKLTIMSARQNLVARPLDIALAKSQWVPAGLTADAARTHREQPFMSARRLSLRSRGMTCLSFPVKTSEGS